MRCALAIMLFAISCGVAPPRLCPGCTPRQAGSFDVAIEKVAGKEPVNCGTLQEGAAYRSAIAAQQQCISSAIASRKAFVAKRQPMGIDSLVIHAVAGSSSGSVSYFFYDSSPCGVTNCGERIVVSSCTSPLVSTKPSGGYTCE